MIYHDQYFEQSCGIYEEFKLSRGEILSLWMYTISAANLKPSDKVLDIGTGRGEIVYQPVKTSYLFVGQDDALSAVRFGKILRT